MFSVRFQTSSIDNGAGDSCTVTSQQVGHRFDYDLSLRRWSCVVSLCLSKDIRIRLSDNFRLSAGVSVGGCLSLCAALQ